MKALTTLMLTFFFTGTNALADEIPCIQSMDSTQTSTDRINNLRFQTLTDVFSIVNAGALLIEVDGHDQVFLRDTLTVEGTLTQLSYIQRRGRTVTGVARVVINRTPNKVLQDRQFSGHVTLSSSKNNDLEPGLLYHFSCRF